MFSLFHKDAATPASHKPGDPSRTTGQQSEAPVRHAAGRKPSPGRQLRSPEEAKRRVYTPQQRLMLLDTWRRLLLET